MFGSFVSSAHAHAFSITHIGRSSSSRGMSLKSRQHRTFPAMEIIATHANNSDSVVLLTLVGPTGNCNYLNRSPLNILC